VAELEESWEAVAQARSERDSARSAYRDALLDLHRIGEAIEAVRRSAAEDRTSRERLKTLETEKERLDASLPRLHEEIEGRLREVRRQGVEIFAPPPQRLIGQLDDDIPILLLPLRLETRFRGEGSQRALLIRIFPDDAAIVHHEEDLTGSELEAGKAYWTHRIRANAEPDPNEADRIVKDAWSQLATRHGAYRSSWIIRVTKPENFDETLEDPALADFPDLPAKPLAWSEAPRSFVLPDRFVVRLFAGGSSREVAGAVIPDDLPLGPDPLEADQTFSRDESTGKLKVGEDLRWLVDFDAAVKVGMALRIPLELPRESAGFDKILVLGMRFATGPERNAELVSRLLEAHRFSEGISLPAQGTPTNNTGESRSGLTTADESVEETFHLEHESVPPAPEPDYHKRTDGQRLAEALGVPFESVAYIPGSRNSDVAEALAMNRALWAATVGSFLGEMFEPNFGSEMTGPLIDKDTAAKLRRFFSTYVTGRGTLPAVRIGEQPYGVLATSSLPLWTWDKREVGRDATFWEALLDRLRRMERTWRDLAGGVSYVGKAGNAFEHLLSIVGLQASSVEFYSRKAISRSYLANYTRFRGTSKAYATDVWEQMKSAIDDNLSAIGLPATNYKLRDLIFWRSHDLLPWPVIDDDPRVPFSETAQLRTFDGSRNYIDWLRTASLPDIRSQVFRDASGAAVPPPDSLLYRTLRASFLEELGRAGRQTVKDRAPAVFGELQAEPPILNIGGRRTFTDADVLNVDASAIGAAQVRTTLGELLVAGVRGVSPQVEAPPEAAGLADLHASLETLSELPTARLERLIAEHIDLCSYRLDSWVQGMFARRLLRQRSGEGRASLHLGAFGWLEGVMPSKAETRRVDPAELPEILRPEGNSTLVEDLSNGGYVHAPSLTHAVTAAVMRNAYLSHAEPERAEMMAVNLSSPRVRTALTYLEGLRNGQELAALLGYQLERGLHENHPGVELDEFIYVLRERFPFTSGKLTDIPGGKTAEEIEARNVINGYDLLEHVQDKTYPYGIAGLPASTPSGTVEAARAAAIVEEIDALADAMDSISDLMLSESVHQVVQGNYDRAKGVLQSITEGQAPPEIQVIETPRSGRSLTFRVGLPLDPAGGPGWNVALTPRGRTDAILNHWLTSRLPDPADVQWQVKDRASAPVFVSLATLNLEPLDCVLGAGERLGDLSGELERFLVHEFRVAHSVPDNAVTYFFEKPDPSIPDEESLVFDSRQAEPNKIPLASIFPLLKALRRLISRSRPLNARDFELPTQAQTIAPGNPKGFDDGTPPLQDLGDLKIRVEAVHAELSTAHTGLDGFLQATVKPLYDALQADPDHVIDAQWAAVHVQLRQRLVSIWRFGVAEALPTAGLEVTLTTIDAMVAQASKTAELVQERLDLARTALDTTFTDPLPVDPIEAARARAARTETLAGKYVEAAKLALSSSTNPLILFKIHSEVAAEVASAAASPISTDGLQVEEWFQSLVRVRDTMGSLGTVSAYGDWTGTGFELIPLQFPVRPGDAWIGTEYGAALGPGDVASVVLAAPLPSVAAPMCGLLFDEWTELVPTTEETSGIAFHFNRPNAMPPQTLLLAVAPRLTGRWSWEDLVAVIVDTFGRARTRAVEPDMLMQTPYFQALPTTLKEFSSFGLHSTVLAAEAAVATRSAGLE
jgi:hypothetical protein